LKYFKNICEHLEKFGDEEEYQFNMKHYKEFASDEK
jgi:hypothetical protein